jgi:hypothetical protein
MLVVPRLSAGLSHGVGADQHRQRFVAQGIPLRLSSTLHAEMEELDRRLRLGLGSSGPAGGSEGTGGHGTSATATRSKRRREDLGEVVGDRDGEEGDKTDLPTKERVSLLPTVGEHNACIDGLLALFARQ